MASKRKMHVYDFFSGGKSNSTDCSSESTSKKPAPDLCRREIKAAWFSRFTWLHFDKENGLFKCEVCVKAGRHNSFTIGKSTKFPKCDDFTKHEKSKDHREAVLSVSSADKGELQKATARVFVSVKEAVIATMKNVYYICKEGMAKEKLASFQEHVRLQGCSALDILSVSDRISYTSHSSVDEFITVMANVIEKDFLGHIRKAKFYALELHESTDTSVSQNLMIYIRAVIDGKVVSHFLSVQHLKRATAENIYNCVLDVLSNKDIPQENLIGLGTDGASVMVGIRKGLVTQLKNVNPFLMSQHCAAHRLALASAQASNSFPYMVKYQGILNDIYKYYHFSPKNTATLQEAQEVLGGANLKFQQVFGTRWLSFKKSVDRVIKCFDSLITALREDVESNTAKGRPQGLIKQIAKYKFLATTYFMADLLSPLNFLCLSLQKKNLLFNEVESQLQICQAAINELKTRDGCCFTEFLSFLPENIHFLDSFQFKGHSITVSKKQMHEFEILKVKLIEKVTENLNNRFCDESTMQIWHNIGILVPNNLPSCEEDLVDYGRDEILFLSEMFGKERENKDGVVFPGIIDFEGIQSEWLMFKHLMFKHKSSTFHDFWNIALHQWETVYPNVCILATVFLTLPQSSVNVERGFSQQNLIKTDLRSSLKVQSLDKLLMVKVEGPDINKVDWDLMFETWATKTRRILNSTTAEKLSKPEH